MKLNWKTVTLGVLALLVVAFAVFVGPKLPLAYRIFVGSHEHETTPPELPENVQHPAILVFSKTNRYRHEEAIPAANAFFEQLAQRRGWSIFETENGAIHSADDLARFDVVIWNNVSGDVLSAEQRQALRGFIERGGGFVAIHGSGGDMSYDEWPWYAESLIGAQFIGHPMKPQFQRATVHVEDRTHPATRDLPESWVRTDEWYSFASSVRQREGFHVLATLDENTYNPIAWGDKNIAMGADHPIMWWHCVDHGRVFYSALGHTASAYSEPAYQRVLEGAVSWAMRNEGDECDF